MNFLVELISGIYQQFGLGSANNGDLWEFLPFYSSHFLRLPFLLRGSSTHEVEQTAKEAHQAIPIEDEQGPSFETEIKDVHIPTDEKPDLQFVEKEVRRGKSV